MSFALDQIETALDELEAVCLEGRRAFHFERLRSTLSRTRKRSAGVQRKLETVLNAGLSDLQALIRDEEDQVSAPEEKNSSVFEELVDRINSFDVTAIEQSSLGLDALLFDVEENSPQPSEPREIGQLRNEGAASELQSRAKELKSLQVYREQLGKVITENMVRQVIKEDPENAGPLNPQRLLVRTIGSMKDISPAYVNRLVPYYDTLLWLEQAGESLSPKSGNKKSSGK